MSLILQLCDLANSRKLCSLYAYFYFPQGKRRLLYYLHSALLEELLFKAWKRFNRTQLDTFPHVSDNFAPLADLIRVSAGLCYNSRDSSSESSIPTMIVRKGQNQIN